MNYSFEIDINDFANSWYFHVNDSSCEYQIELGRRPIPINYNYMPQYNVEKSGPIAPVQVPFVYISSSNELEAPNDHILFNNKNKIYFRNVKTNQIIEKDVKDFPFIVKDNEFVNVYELYKKLYKDEIIDGRFDRMNPSSGKPSSGNLSSWYNFNSEKKTDLVTGGKKLEQSSNLNGILLTTGATEEANLQNIYDIAGNVYEWTLEFYSADNPCTYRGGSCSTSGLKYPANYRYINTVDASYSDIGFRIGLWN